MKKLKSLLALGLVGVLVVGCGGSSDKKDDNASKDDKKVATLATDSDITKFDSTTENNAKSLEGINAIQEGLYRLELDGTGVPGMAKDVKISDDQLVYTFTLRDSKWSNGDPVTANDFVFAFHRLFDDNVAESTNNRFFAMKGLLGLVNAEEVAAGTKPVEELGIKAIDEKTVELKLQDPCPIIESLLAYPCFFPLNEKFVTEQGDKYGTEVKKVIACGPYKLTKWESNNTIAYEKNENYYGKDDIKVDELVFKVNTEANSRALAYEAGEVLFTPITSDLVAQYEDDKGFIKHLESYVGYISFNQDRIPDFKNANLRKAIAMSIDKKALCEEVLKDGSEPADHIIPKDLAKGPDGKDFRDSVGKDVKYLATDKAKAKEYYETAKQELGKDKFEFALMVGERDPNRAIAEFLKEQIEKNLPGLTVTINIQPAKSFYQMATDKNFDALSIMWGPDYPYPTTYTDLWASDSPNNYSNYKSEKYDELQKATTSGDLLDDPVARWDALKEMEKILLEDDAAIAPLFQRGWVGLQSSKIKGIGYRTSGVKWDYRNVELVD